MVVLMFIGIIFVACAAAAGLIASAEGVEPQVTAPSQETAV
ncbi:hypothetical protein [Devosia soli]|nr:hypothetical protein [Devosia soli]